MSLRRLAAWTLVAILALNLVSPALAAAPASVSQTSPSTTIYRKPGETVTVSFTYTSQPVTAGTTTATVALKNGATTVAETANVSIPDGVSLTASVTVTIPSATADQTTVTSITVTNSDGSATATGSTSVVIDGTLPVAQFTAPAADAFLRGSVAITGTASDANLSGWVLEYAPGANATTGFVNINTGTAPVTNGPLGTWNTTSLADGAYTLRLTANDLAGNSQVTSINVTVDNTLPVATVASPVSPWTGKGQVSFVGTASDANILSWSLTYTGPTNGTIANGTASATSSILGQLDTGLMPDGTYTVTLTVTDRSGNSSTGAVTLQVVTPSVTARIATPTPNAVVGGKVGITGVTDGWNYWLWYSSTGAGRTTISQGSVKRTSLAESWDTSAVPDGAYTLYLQANNPWVSDSTAVSIVVDNTPPALGFSPGQAQWVLTIPADLAVGYTFTEANPAQLQISLVDVSGKVLTSVAPTVLGGGVAQSRTDSLKLPGDLPDGLYELRITMTDKAGNSSTITRALGVHAQTAALPILKPLSELTSAPLTLSWSLPSSPIAVKLVEILRAVAGNEEDTVAYVTPATTTWTDPRPVQGAVSYRVKVTYISGVVLLTEPVATWVDTLVSLPLLQPLPEVTTSPVTLRWKVPGDGDMAAYDIYRWTAGGQPVLIATVSPQTDRFVDSPDAEGTYFYRVTARDRAGNQAGGGTRKTRLDLTPPSLPDFRIARFDSSSIRFSWTGASPEDLITVLSKHGNKLEFLGEARGSDGAFGTTLSPGEHSVVIRVADAAGNYSETPPVLVTVRPGLVAVKLNGAFVDSDTPAVTLNGRTYVPLRALAELLGANVTWDPDKQRAVIRDPKTSSAIAAVPGSRYLEISGTSGQRSVAMDVSAVVENGRVMIPLRYVAEVFGLEVGWEEKSKTVVLTRKAEK